MKKYAFNVLIIFLLFFVQRTFAQDTQKNGTYYAFDTRPLGGLNGKQEAIIKTSQNPDKLDFTFGAESEMIKVSENRYQEKDNKRQIVFRADGDIELYTIDENSIITDVFLFTKVQKETKERWKKNKSALNAQLNKKAENYLELQKLNLLSYYEQGKTEPMLQLEQPYKAEEKIEISSENWGYPKERKCIKIDEHVYIYGYINDSYGVLSFIKFFPNDNKVAFVQMNVNSNELEGINPVLLQRRNTQNEPDNKKAKAFGEYVANYMSKQRMAFFSDFKNNNIKEVPQAKVNALIKGDFGDNFTYPQIKVITSAWTLQRNDLGRVLNRFHNVLVYLKEKSTGKCYIAFCMIWQDFDGVNYGEARIIINESRYFRMKNKEGEELKHFLVKGTYEVNCNEITK